MDGSLTRKINRCMLAGVGALAMAFSGFSNPALADDILKGLRGPTDWQFEGQCAYSGSKKEDKTVTTVKNALTVKYWNVMARDRNGNDIGIRGFATVPWKRVCSPNGCNSGWADATLALGVRGTLQLGGIGSFHTFFYGGGVIPMGETRGKVPLGNGRYDGKAGWMWTLLSAGRKLEMDGVAERTFNGKNKQGAKSHDETYGGLLIGGEIAKNTRAATGPTALWKENKDSSFGWRAVFRHDPSKKYQLGIWAEKSIRTINMPRETRGGVYARCNLGK